MISSGAEGVGLATIARDGSVLDTWFVTLQLVDSSTEAGTVQVSREQSEKLLGPAAARSLGADDRRGVEVVCVQTTISSLANPALDAHDMYLRLHLLSHRLIRPHDASMEGIFLTAVKRRVDFAWPVSNREFEFAKNVGPV